MAREPAPGKSLSLPRVGAPLNAQTRSESGFARVSEGTRTPDRLDHNQVGDPHASACTGASAPFAPHRYRPISEVCGDSSGPVPKLAPLRSRCPRRRRNPAYTQAIVATHRADNNEERHLELPVEELLPRARPLPPHDEMVIEDIDEEEGAAFVAAVES
jgi:hypothetical protein